MKNLIEILGGTQILLGLSFDPDVLLEERLTVEHRGFLAFLRVVEEHLPRMDTKTPGVAHPRYEDLPILRANLVKHLYQIDRNNWLRLLSDTSLRKICGFTKVPSDKTFSRRLEAFANANLAEVTLALLVLQYHEGSLVQVIASDPTSIRAREKAHKKSRTSMSGNRNVDGPGGQGSTAHRTSTCRAATPAKSLAELDRGCGWG